MTGGHDTILIQGGLLIDGTGSQPLHGDVLVCDGRIEAVSRGELNVAPDTLVLSAENRVVCPGLIDTHAHDDLYLLQQPDGAFKVRQGITTVVMGNCGVSVAPVTGNHRSELMEQLKLLGSEALPAEKQGFADFEAYYDSLRQSGPGIHGSSLVGHGMIRLSVMGPTDQLASPPQIEKMCGLLERCLDQGAAGLSLGLIYPPGAYASFEELLALARVIEGKGAIVTSHIRSEGAQVIEAVEEMIDLSRKTGAAVHISHHKVADPANRGKSYHTLQLIDNARAEGLAITADIYPYCAGSTYLAAILPPRAFHKGLEQVKRALADKKQRSELQQSIEQDPLDRWHSLITGREEYRLVIANSQTQPDYIGRSIAEIAADSGQSPYDLAFDLIASEGMGVTMIIHSMAEEDVRRILRHPAVMFGSDGIPDLNNGKPHPRLTGTFPRVLGRYVRELKQLELTEAVRRMTSLPADTFGFSRKGRLLLGMDADILVFNPETVIDRSTFEDPFQSPEGIERVLVGGKIALTGGEVTGEGKGEVLRPSR